MSAVKFVTRRVPVKIPVANDAINKELAQEIAQRFATAALFTYEDAFLNPPRKGDVILGKHQFWPVDEEGLPNEST